MKKILTLTLILLLCFGIFFTTAACEDKTSTANMLINSSFDGSEIGPSVTPDGWRFDYSQHAGGNVTYRLIEENGKTFQITHSDLAFSQLTQVVSVLKNTTYELAVDYNIEETKFDNTTYGFNAGFIQDEAYIAFNQTTVKKETAIASFNSGNNTTLTLALRMGLPARAAGITDTMAKGTVKIYSVSLRRFPVAKKETLYTVGSVNSNKISNGDFIERDSNGYAVENTNNTNEYGNSYVITGGYKFAADSNLPSGWKFSSKKNSTTYRMDRWQANNGNYALNFFQFRLSADVAYLSQKIKVKPNTTYVITFDYWIPSNDYLYDMPNEKPYIDEKDRGGRLFGSGDTVGDPVGIHGAVLQDNMYIGNAKTSVAESTVTMPWKTYKACVYTNSLTELNFAIRIGYENWLTTGIIRVTNISVKIDNEKLSQSGPYSVHSLSSYTGNSDTKTRDIVIAVILGLFGFALCVTAIWLLSINPKKKASVIKKVADSGGAEQINDSNVVLSSEAGDNPSEIKEELSSEAETDSSDDSVADTVVQDNATDKTVKKSSAAVKISEKSATAKGLNKLSPALIFSSIFALCVVVGVVLRIIFAYSFKGQRDDINNILKYISYLSDYGKALFYETADSANNSYLNPPLYLYILEIIGKFTQSRGMQGTAMNYIFLLKLPNIIADAVTALFIFLLAKKYTNIRWAAILGGLYILNPVTMISSSMWGGFDSTAIMFASIALYFVIKRNYLFSMLFYTFAILTKISMLFILPAFIVYMLTTYIIALKNYGQLRADNKAKGKIITREFDIIWKLPVYLFLCITLVYLVCVPFIDLSDNIFEPFSKFFFDNLNQQYFFSNNAFNMFTLMDRNTPKIFAENNIIIIINLLCVMFMFILNTVLYLRRKNRANLIIIMALSILIVFTFMVNMNPRYSLLLLPVLLYSFIAIKDKRLLILFTLLSTVIFINNISVLVERINLNTFPDWMLNTTTHSAYAGSSTLSTNPAFLIIMSFISILLTLYFAYTAFDIIINNRRLPLMSISKPKFFVKSMVNLFSKPIIIDKSGENGTDKKPNNNNASSNIKPNNTGKSNNSKTPDNSSKKINTNANNTNNTGKRKK